MTIPEGWAQVTMWHSGAAFEGEVAVVLGVEINGSPDPDDVAEVVGGYYALHFREFTSSTVTFERAESKVGPDATGGTGLWTLGTEGLVGGQVSPGNCAFLIRKTTPLGGRQGRGRIYAPGVPETLTLNASNIDPDEIGAIQIEVTAFLTDIAGDDYPLVVLHGDDLVPTPVTNLVVDSRLATQRRRMRR